MTDPRTILQRTLEAAEQLQGGVCPDGGGPQCICKCLGLMGQCSALTAARNALETPSDDHPR